MKDHRNRVRLYVAGPSAERETFARFHSDFAAEGFNVVSDWPFLDPQIDMEKEAKIWLGIQHLIQTSHCLLIPPAVSHLRGALVEVGMALAFNKEVHIVGHNPSMWTWAYHPRVRSFPTITEWMRYIDQEFRP